MYVEMGSNSKSISHTKSVIKNEIKELVFFGRKQKCIFIAFETTQQQSLS